LVISACAKNPDKIPAAYVSPALYQNYDCDQVREEIIRVSHRVDQVSGKQRSERTKDTVATTVGVIIFWPALFFLIGDDKKDEIARLKGEYEALEIAAIQKKCTVANEIREARTEIDDVVTGPVEEEAIEEQSNEDNEV
jgi:hypothetical protein